MRERLRVRPWARRGSTPSRWSYTSDSSHCRAKFLIFMSAAEVSVPPDLPACCGGTEGSSCSPPPGCSWGRGQVFLERSETAGSCVTPKFRGHHAVRAPHVPLKSQSSVCVHCLWTCMPLNCTSRVWVRVDCKKSALAKCRQPLVHAESSNLLSIRWSVSQRGLTEQ